MRIGVLTGGGDAPGLNPAIAGIVEKATVDGIEIVGLKRGWEALAIRDNDNHVVPLGPEVIRDFSRMGGRSSSAAGQIPWQQTTTEPRS